MLSIVSQLIFGQNIFGSQHDGSGKMCTWKDRSLCFDLRHSDLELSDGEQLIACYFPIEDIKGNPDELGLLKVTNLRLVWICCNKKRVNLSIGWRTVSLAFRQNLKDSLGNPVTSLCVLTKYESTKYEFIFNKMPAYDDNSAGRENWSAIKRLKWFCTKKSLSVALLSPIYLVDPFDVVFKVWQSYRQTQLFRFCRANLTQLLSSGTKETAVGIKKGAVRLNELNKLPSEEIIEMYSGIVQCESRAVKYTGSMILTNIRIIWIDDSLPLRNLSMPYIRVSSVKLKQSERILISAQDYLATSNQIEFRCQNSDRSKPMKQIFEQIQNLHALYRSKPRYGPESCDECITIMSYLRPIGHYFDGFDGAMGKNLENLGPEMNFDRPVESGSTSDSPDQSGKISGRISNDDDDIDMMEAEFSHYNSPNNYTNEQSIDRDKELIYSPGEFASILALRSLGCATN